MKGNDKIFWSGGTKLPFTDIEKTVMGVDL